MTITKSLSKTILKISLAVMMLLVITFCFSACGGLGRFDDNPNADDIVYGNGGLTVQKGDYLYFVNGYIDTSSVGETNKYGDIDQSAIYRVKLTDGKVVETNVEYDEDGNRVVDETQEINDVDIVVPKVAGFEYSDLYIFGDYLYYTTPNNKKDNSGNVLTSQLQYYRTPLDRSGSNDLLYETISDNSEVSLSMYQIGDIVYQIILDGETLVVNTIDGEDVTRTTVTEHAHSASSPVYANSNSPINAIDNYIYFTEPFENENITGAVLKAYNLATKETSTVLSQENVTYEIINTNGRYLYCLITDAGTPGFTTKIYAMSISANTDGTFKTNTTLVSKQSVGSSANITEYALAASNHGPAIIYTDGTNTYFKKANSDAGITVLTSDVVSEIVEVTDQYMYYISSSNLYRIDYTQANQTAELMIPSDVTPKADIANNFDVDGDNIYFFVQYTNNYYMHYVTYSAGVTDDAGNPYTHFIGKLLEEDYLGTEDDSTDNTTTE